MVWITYAHLILDAGDVEHGLDLLPQLEPHPVAQLHVLAQVALHHAEGNPAERRNQAQWDTRGTGSGTLMRVTTGDCGGKYHLTVPRKLAMVYEQNICVASKICLGFLPRLKLQTSGWKTDLWSCSFLYSLREK